MIRSTLLAAISAVALAACTSAPAENAATGNAEIADNVSNFDLAMTTVGSLVEDGNTQVAIDRLTQLLGDPSLTDEQLGEALLRRGELRYSEDGYDIMGAISDYEEIINTLPQTEAYPTAGVLLNQALEKASSLEAQLNLPETTRQEKFDILMQLGKHQEAIDLMIANDLTPGNETLIAMYQIGYLCEGDELTGRTYEAVEDDGTEHALRFCDFGK